MERLEEIRGVVDIPFVLHGASGLSQTLVQETIRLGICKVNVGTELKNAFVAGLRQHLTNHPDENDPRRYFSEAIAELKRVAAEKITMCKSAQNRVGQ